MSEPVVNEEDGMAGAHGADLTGCDYRPTWKEGVPYCRCGADLSESAAVAYTERYEATYGETSFGEAIFYDTSTVDSEACCTACGQLLDYDDVSLG